MSDEPPAATLDETAAGSASAEWSPPESSPAEPTSIESARGAGSGSQAVERRPLPVTAQMVVLTVLTTVVFLMFLLIEPTPRWVLVVGAIVAVLGTDGALRSAWPDRFRQVGEAAPYVFLPALYVIATPVLIEHNVRGAWIILAAFAASAGFGVMLLASVGSVRPPRAGLPDLQDPRDGRDLLRRVRAVLARVRAGPRPRGRGDRRRESSP